MAVSSIFPSNDFAHLRSQNVLSARRNILMTLIQRNLPQVLGDDAPTRTFPTAMNSPIKHDYSKLNKIEYY